MNNVLIGSAVVFALALCLLLLKEFGSGWSFPEELAEGGMASSTESATSTPGERTPPEIETTAQREPQQKTAPTPQQGITPSQQPQTTQPTPAPTQPSTPEPRTMPADSKAATLATLETFDLRLTESAPVALPGSNATLVVTSITNEGASARLFLNSVAGNLSYEVITGSTRLLPHPSANNYAIEVVSINEKTDEVRIILYRFPHKKVVYALPHTVYLLQGQVAAITTFGNTVEELELRSVESDRATIHHVMRVGGEIEDFSTRTMRAGWDADLEHLRFVVTEVDASGRYDTREAQWGPHVVGIQIEGM